MSNPQAMMLVQDEGEIKRTKIKAKPTREEQSELAAYRHEDGALIFPAIAFRNGLLAVASSYKPPKSKKSMAHYVAHVRPIVNLLENDLLDFSNVKLVDRLQYLKEILPEKMRDLEVAA